ncbi:MAG: multidrug transporter [Planctomycetaceae bacterium]|nr:multidrug transporter [Planctomycetaceae bacterium]
MLRNWFLPMIALSMLSVAGYHVTHNAQAKAPLDPPAAPPRSPFGLTVAAVGIAEPRTEDISIGTHVTGVVQEVFVKVGDKVAAGARLFRIDDRQVSADLAVREAMLATARAQLKKLEQSPRPEELPASEAAVREAEASMIQREDHYRRQQKIFDRDSRVITAEEIVASKQGWLIAKEQHAKAVADDQLLRAGTWEPDLLVARATVAQNQAQVDQIRVDLDRLAVKAPVSGEILRVNVRPGEYVGQPAGQTLIILGDMECVHVRADIDEVDIPRLQVGNRARAFVRGASDRPIPLEFVRVEPYVLPKKSLTGNSNERVDTRVLQVIFAIDQSQPDVYMGQQLDVFVDAKPVASPLPSESPSASLQRDTASNP